MVLVHGSGPNDRDETIGPNKVFKDLAWGLASRGVTVLRYDKRTYAYATKFDERAVKSLTVQGEVIDDALAALQLLLNREEIDPQRVFLLGHSLGATLARLEMRIVLHPEAEELSKQLASAWAGFARDGNPGSALLPSWPRYDLEKRAVMVFDIPSCSVVNDPDREAREFLKDRPFEGVL